MVIQKILIIERDVNMQHYYHAVLHKLGQVLNAHNEREALHLLIEHPDVDLILINSRLTGGNMIDSIDLIADIRRMGYAKPIIAASSSERTRKLMLDAGCTHEFAKNGLVLEQIARDILQQPSGIHVAAPPAKVAQ